MANRFSLAADIQPTVDSSAAEREASDLAETMEEQLGNLQVGVDDGGMGGGGMGSIGGARAGGGGGMSPGGAGLAAAGAKRLGGASLAGAAGAAIPVALGGAVAAGIYNKLSSASPALQQTNSMFGEAMSLFFRPFGNFLSGILRPWATSALNMAIQFNDLYSKEGLGIAVTAMSGKVQKAWATAVGDQVAAALPGDDEPQSRIVADALTDLNWGLIVASGGMSLPSSFGQSLGRAAGQRLDWGDHIPNLTWSKFVEGVLTWSRFINPMLWGQYIGDLVWDRWLSDIRWDSWIPSLSWGSFISGVSLAGFVTPVNLRALVNGTSIGPTDVIDSAASLVPSNLIGSPATIGGGDLIGSTPSAGDIIDILFGSVSIDADAVLSAITGGGGEEENPHCDQRPCPEGTYWNGEKCAIEGYTPPTGDEPTDPTGTDNQKPGQNEGDSGDDDGGYDPGADVGGDDGAGYDDDTESPDGVTGGDGDDTTYGGGGDPVDSGSPRRGSTGDDSDNDFLAQGGVARRPTQATIGEAGPEAVVPLDDLQREIARAMRQGMQVGQSGGGADSDVATKLDTLIQEMRRTRDAINAMDLNVDMDDGELDPF